jgi:hypothetical protein
VEHETWVEATLDDFDDAEFPLESARIDGGRFVLRGELDWAQSVSYLDGWAGSWRKRHVGLKRRYGHARRLIRTPVMLTINGARSFTVDDRAGVGVLILENCVAGATSVTLTGVVPCIIEIATSMPQSTRFLVGRADTSRAEAEAGRPRARRKWRWLRSGAADESSNRAPGQGE